MSTFAVSRASLNQRRILFVDDEPFALEVLQRIFAPMANEWHMEFVTSGVQALERLHQQRFDAIVTDMGMPGMNGAQLLEQVQHRHPSVARIILSGHADYDLVLKADVGVVDVAFTRKQDKTLEIQKLANQKDRELKQLDNEFKEVLKDVD